MNIWVFQTLAVILFLSNFWKYITIFLEVKVKIFILLMVNYSMPFSRYNYGFDLNVVK